MDTPIYGDAQPGRRRQFCSLPKLMVVAGWVALFLMLVCPRAGAASVQQTVTLKPGWNSVWLTVDPLDATPTKVFAGLPVDQVWCWFPVDKSVEFLNDPSNGLFNVPGWSVYIPPSSPVAFLSNLGAVQGHRPYLIKLTGTANATLTVTGTASVKPLKWRADSFNLFGYDVDPTVGGGPAASFFTGTSVQGQAMYRLDAPSGVWQVLPASYTIRAGEAYWVFSKGNSTFNGGLSLSPGSLDFGPAESEKLVTFTNSSAYSITLSVSNPGNVPLVYSTGSGTAVWNPLTTLQQTLAAGASVTVRFGARRAGLTAPVTGQTVQVTGAGSSILVPASIALPPVAASAAGQTGLWVGTATLSKVLDVNGTPNTPVATAAPLNLRVIIHVDGSGQATLLKQVTLMRKNVPAGTVSDPVLVTDDTRLADFKGASETNGKQVGRRLSAVGFDFSGNGVQLAGSFGSSLAGVVNVPRTLPTNPFKHKFHPDHDDLDASFNPIPNPFPAGTTPDQEEVWDVTRNLQLTFDAPAADNSPASGFAKTTGTYRETVVGLHKQALVVEGAFLLQRVNTVDQLNPAP